MELVSQIFMEQGYIVAASDFPVLVGEIQPTDCSFISSFNPVPCRVTAFSTKENFHKQIKRLCEISGGIPKEAYNFRYYFLVEAVD